MPDLLTKYALATGLKIDKPTPFENYFPIPEAPYILINGSSGMGGKNYDYFNDVVRLLKPHLPGYLFLQIGNKGDIPLMGVQHIQGLTSIPQMMFVIRHCALLIGNDSSAIHIAASYDKPLVGVYGMTHPKIHGPLFGNKENQRLLESHRKGNKPTYNPNEAPKTVNFILPEQIAKAALDLLGVQPKSFNEKTLFIGAKYHAITLELVPDQVIGPNDFPNIVLNARMDYHFDEAFLYSNLVHHKMCVVTDKPFDVEILRRCRDNVQIIAYKLTENYDFKFAEELRAAGLPLTLFTEQEGEALAKIRLDFFDFRSVTAIRKFLKSDIENQSEISKNTHYRSNRYILSQGKIYLNQIDWKNDQPRLNQADNEGVVIDTSEFWEDSDYYLIYNNG